MVVTIGSITIFELAAMAKLHIIVLPRTLKPAVVIRLKNTDYFVKRDMLWAGERAAN